MPCRDWEGVHETHEERILSDANYSLHQKIAEQQKRLDEFAAMLCGQCQVLEKVYQTAFTPTVLAWWQKHKEEDAKREANEKEIAKQLQFLKEQNEINERELKMLQFNKLKAELGL